jgi:hypothetical protein
MVVVSCSGTQSVAEDIEQMTMDKLRWYSSLTWTGEYEGSQITSPDRFRLSVDAMKNVFQANGTLKTVVDGVEHSQPGNGQRDCSCNCSYVFLLSRRL